MKLRLLAVLIAGIIGGSLALAQQPQDEKKGMKKSEAKAVTVRLAEQNKSGEKGTVRLTPQGDKTKVDVNLKGAPKGVQQPAHIHEGSCAKLDPKPKYPLQNVVDGKSSSEVPAKLEELTGGNMAINVHKSAEDVKTYVACGDIKKPRAAKKSSEKKS
jgi:hypothetical protein